METTCDFKENISQDGFAILDDVYSENEVEKLLFEISNVDQARPTFRKTEDLFAIRQFFQEVPSVIDLVFNSKLKEIIAHIFGDEFFVVKSIYFDKPEKSNWFVSYHQDLTISVDKKVELDGFGPWSTKLNQYSVQPPLLILQDNFTIRIHLDDADENNGALRVIKNSHKRGICRPETINLKNEIENICRVRSGGIMIMKPLLLHSSGRTINNQKRRILHIEFSRIELPEPLIWSERLSIKTCR